MINALLLCLVDLLLPQFQVDSFGWAFLAALVIGIISMVLNTLTGSGGSRLEVRRGRRPPDDDDKGGGGPVIDV